MLKNNRGQVVIFVIIAIFMVVGVLVYFFVRGIISPNVENKDFSEVYEYYLTCIEEKTKAAADIAGSQGGRIDAGQYIPGSEYAPFSNQLNFLGFPVPYWFYIAGNGIVNENVPSKQEVENEIADYVKFNLRDCNFDSFYEKGMQIDIGEPDVRVNVNDNFISVSVNNDLVLGKDSASSKKSDFEVEVQSDFGRLYNVAKEIYNRQRESAFLENYSVDVLRLYAPVDGSEISCSPKIWNTREVFDSLTSGLEANIAAIKFGRKSGNAKSDYFVVDNVGENVNMIYSKNWPTKIEIYGNGVDNDLMVAEPVGNQEGLGIMGFCYVPYHYVYDVSYPVLIQVYNDQNEIFQFPVVVVIDKNVPRKAILGEASETPEFDLCEFKTQDVQVNLYDISLNRVDGNISFGCFNQECRIGETKEGSLNAKMPACVNGFVKVRANGFAEKRQLLSSNSESSTDIILDREYEEVIELKVDGINLNGYAIVSFNGEEGLASKTVVMPENNKVKLSQGKYELRVYVYSNTSITIPSSSKEECREVSRPGIAGFFGATKEECFDITIPETKIETALIGGGKQEIYLLPEDLEKGDMRINVQGLPKPTSLEQLQQNLIAYDTMGAGVEFS